MPLHSVMRAIVILVGREGESEGPPLYITTQILVFPLLTVLYCLLKTRLQECDMSTYQPDRETDTHNVTLCHTYKLGLTVSIVISRCAELRGEAFLLLVFTFSSSRITIHNLSRTSMYDLNHACAPISEHR